MIEVKSELISFLWSGVSHNVQGTMFAFSLTLYE